MKSRRLDSHGGFTLLELILALAVVAVIAAISVISVRLAATSQQIGERKTELYQRLRFIGEQLTEKIHSAHPVYLPSEEQTLFANLKQNPAQAKPVLAFEGGEHSLRFITTSPRLQDTGERAPDLNEVRFYLGKNPETDQQGVILMERPLSYQTALRDDPESLQGATFVTLAENVDHLKFRYLRVRVEAETVSGQATKTVKYLTEWVDTLNAEPIEFVGQSSDALNQRVTGAAGRVSLPRAIEVSLGLRERAGPGTADSAPTVAVPPVVIPLRTGLVFERATPVEADEPGAG